MKRLLRALCVVVAFAIPSLVLEHADLDSSQLRAAAIQDRPEIRIETTRKATREFRSPSQQVGGRTAGTLPTDFCQTAPAITDGAPSAEGDNRTADNFDEFEASCVQGSDFDVWYLYRASCDGKVIVDTFGSGQLDTVLSVFNDCGGQELACNDDAGDGLLSEISFQATAGNPYWIRMASTVIVGTPDAAPGDYDINIRCVRPVPNDTCRGAEIVTDGRPATEGDNSSSTAPDDAEASCQDNANKDVWFEYRATCDGIVTVDTDSSLQSDTVLSVYDDCGGNELACNDDRVFPEDFLSELSFAANLGKTYWIRLASFDAGSGDYDLNIECCVPDEKDECAGAQRITCQDVDRVNVLQKCYTGNDNTVGPQDPVTSCELAGGGPYGHDASWWYEFLLPNDADVRIKLCGNDPLMDSVIGVYQGVCGDANEIACDDDGCVASGFGAPEVFIPNMQAGTYLVNVQAYTGGYDPAQDFIIEIDCIQPNQIACCFTGGCDEMDRDSCLAQGGVPLGPNSNCTDDLTVCSPNQPCDECGPGQHWIDQCAAGTDSMTSGALLGIDYDLDCVPDTNLVMSGPVFVSRSNPLDTSAQFAGVGSVDGHLDVLDTEMVSLQLSGGGIQLTAGGGFGQGGVLPRTLGAIVELANPALGDSFFDVMAEIDLGGGQFAYNRVPIRVKTEVDCVPPDRSYLHPDGCFPVFRSLTGSPTDVPVANIVTANHSTFLECGDEAAGACGVPNGTPFCDDAECCRVVCENEPDCCGVAWDSICVSIAGDLCARPQTCCLPGGTCADLTVTDCRRRDGAPGPAGSSCQDAPDQCREDSPCAHCGGADHWVDNCPAGADRMPSRALAGLDLDGDCQADTNLILSGPVTVQRGPGSPNAHTIDTEIIAMRLTGGGVIMRAGAGGGQNGVLAASKGQIIEQPNSPDLADSFFDVFVEIDSPSLAGPAYNQTPLRVESKIDCIPPQTTYIHVEQCIPLYSSPVPGTGAFVGNLVAPNHQTYPTEACCLPNNTCQDLRNTDCRARGGIPRGADTSCDDPNLRCVIEVDQFDHSNGLLEILGPNGFQELIPVAGPTTVHVFFEGNAEGDCNDDDNDGLDEVEAEMVSLNLQGISPTFGPIRVGLNPDPALRSLGEIRENANANDGILDVPPFAQGGTADSFFDVFFEIELGGQRFITIDPKRMRARITHKPPVAPDIYENPDRIQLYDLSGRPTPYWIGSARHRPRPAVEIDFMEETTALIQLVGGPIGPNPTPYVLRGPAEAHVFFEGANEGDSFDHDNDGLDEVQTELVAMDLSGGGVTLSVNPILRSTGEIEEQANNTPGILDVPPFAPGLADSFFDVFFELEIGGGLVVHNRQPLRIRAVIDHKPPVARYIHVLPLLGPVELYDENGNATGVFIVEAEHYTGHIEIDRFDRTIAQLELINPTGGSEIINLEGPATAHVFFESAEGAADDDDGDSLDEVQTEMVALDLTGNSSLGPVRVSLNQGIRSLGEIEEQTNNTPGTLDVPPFTPSGVADSFFDVWFEIEVGGTRLFGQAPKRMRSIITHKPPAVGDFYENPDTIALLDEAGNPTGYFIGPNQHVPNPGRRACCFDDQSCVDLKPDDCRAQGGIPQPAGVFCDSDANLCATSTPCEDCGPGPHWIDQCPAGTDILPSGAKLGIDTDGDCVPDINLVMSGPAHVHRSNPLDDSLNFPGVAAIDQHRDVIDTEMVSLNLTGGGISLIAGAGLGQGGVLPPSLGTIVEQPADPLLGDSFFDIFAEVNLGGGQFGYLRAPLRVRSKIDCVPPDTTYIHPVGCFPLYRSLTGGPDDTPLANIVTANHSTFLDCGSPSAGDCLADGGNGTPYCDDEDCCRLVCDTQEPDCCLVEWDDTCARIAQDVCRPTDACCFNDGSCAQIDRDDCLARGGTPLGPDSECSSTGDTCAQSEVCEDCGPGDHWIDQCPAGLDNMPSGAKVGIDLDGDCVADRSVVMNGPVLVQRSDSRDDSVNYPGSSTSPGHRDVIDTEILSMDLSGGGLSMIAGGGRGQGGALRRSLGAIVEQPADASLGDSFFDVFFEVDIGGGLFGYNQAPVRVRTKIDCVPPDAEYIHPVGCTPLYDSPTSTAPPIANLVSARHGTFPECGDPATGDCFTPNGTPFCDDKVCCDRVCALDPICCTAGWNQLCSSLALEVCPRPVACCLPDESCVELDEITCRTSGGVSQGFGSACDDADLCKQDTPCEECGPGPHWVDSCPAGTDIMPSAALIGIDTDGDCVEDLSMRLTGPAHVRRSGALDDSLFYPGEAPLDGHLDVIDTEMVSLSLTGGGVTLTAGFGYGQGGVLPGSLGTIVEQSGTPDLADSFFDIVAEVELPNGTVLYTRDPLRVTSKIDCIPPDTTYIHPQGCFPLYRTPFGSPNDLPAANIVTANHSTFPACGDPAAGNCLDPNGNGTPFCDDAECCEAVCAIDSFCCDTEWSANCSGLAFEVCVNPQGCCFDDESCADIRAAECRARGGVPQGLGSACNPNENICQISTPCEDCGPGPHWIDQCPAGTDIMPSGAKLGIDTDLDCQPDVNLVMFGPAHVRRSGPLDDSLLYPGVAPLDGHLDVIDTEMVSLSLTGGGLRLTAGFGYGQGAMLRPSYGTIVEQGGDPAFGDSFFDIMAEIDLGGGQFGYTRTPIRVRSKIDCIPPDTTYIHPDGCFPLYRSVNGLPSDTPIANIVTADHSTFLDCGDPSAGPCDIPNGTPYCDDATCCERVCDPAVAPQCCSVGWDAQCVSIAADLCIGKPANVREWETIGFHGRDFSADWAMSIPPRNLDGTSAFSEPRITGLSRLRVRFDNSILPQTALPDNVLIRGVDADGNPVDLSGHAINTVTVNNDEELLIRITPKLPDFAAYVVALDGVLATDGSPVGGDTERCMTALLGDVNNDIRIAANDVGGTASFVPTDPITPAVQPFHARADVNADGRIVANDVGGVAALVGRDARRLVCPAIPLP